MSLSTKMGPGGNITTNGNNYIFNKYTGQDGIGGSSIANRNAKDRLASFCNTGCNEVVTPTETPTILVYNTDQGSSIVWSGFTFTRDTNLPNFSYTAVVTSTLGTSSLPSPANLIGATIGNTVPGFAVSTFSGCSILTSVIFTLPSIVRLINLASFDNCFLLASITIPTSVTGIGSSVFRNCSALKSITIPNTVILIGTSVFQNCTAMTSATLPISIRNVTSQMFLNCSSLTSITIPNVVTSIGTNGFRDCTSLRSVIFTPTPTLRIINGTAFQRCLLLTSITIPNTVTSIGTNAFVNSGLTTVFISSATATTLGKTSPTTNPPGVSFFGRTVATVLPPP